MPYQSVNGEIGIYLSPQLRGAADNIRDPLYSISSSATVLEVASQQIADRKLVNALVGSRIRQRGQLKVLLESDYLYEDVYSTGSAIWREEGEHEEHRQCFLALIRSGAEISGDQVSSALQHVNMLVAEQGDGVRQALLTSANLSPSSLDRHLNWGLSLTDEASCTALSTLFKDVLSSRFQNASLQYSTDLMDGSKVRIAAGTKAQSSHLAVELIENARSSIYGAWFNIAKNSLVVDALARATVRGIQVLGVVDGDQAPLAWNAVPMLYAAGARIHYYPGLHTGAIGRMHYKMMVVDDAIVYFSTANASKAAESSFELSVALYPGETGNFNPASYVKLEILRLLNNSVNPGV